MTDDVDIRSGSVVAVDTETLHVAAAGFATVVTELAEIRGMLRDVASRLAGVDDPLLDGTPGRAQPLVWRAGAVTDVAAGLESRLRRLATIYEVVELWAARSAAEAAGDEDGMGMLTAQLGQLAFDEPTAYAEAMALQLRWRLAISSELIGQTSAVSAPFGPPLSAAIIAALAATNSAVQVIGRGVIARGQTLSGSRPMVAVTMLGGGPRPGDAPASLQAAAARIPGGDTTARVRVERYAMSDGSQRFAVYIAGTRGAGPTDAWDMQSNTQLYLGERSASFEATERALRQAGAKPGDAFYDFGHSQGGMIAAHLALEGDYDTRALVTFGSPVEADVGPHTLSVELRHTDDPVVALVAGGSPAGVGAQSSFIAERVADPAPSVNDVTLTAHHLSAYEHTAGLLDSSSDPRMTSVREMFTELGAADSVEVFEFAAERQITPAPAVDDLDPKISPGGSSPEAAG